MTKRVLIVAYYFHPDLEVGAVRSVKFAKFLPESGWQPIVLTVKTSYYQKTDPSPLPFDCVVYRTSKWPTLGDLYARMKQKSVRAATDSAKTESDSKPQAPEASFTPAGRESFLKRMLKMIFWVPDYQIGWLIPGTWKAVRAVWRDKIDVIYASGPPRTGHWVGLLASIITRKPLVVDYRDPLVLLRVPKERSKRIERNINRAIERFVNRHASLVLTTTPEFRDMLKEIHSPNLDNKCHSIINGYDAEDFPASLAAQREQRKQIYFLYAGTLYEGRDPRQLVIALGELVKEGFVRVEDIAVDFFGPIEIDPAPLRAIIEAQGLGEVVKFRPLVPRSEYLRLICSAEVLVLLQSEKNPVQIPAKTFEYLATGNEILVLATPGATTNFLRKFENVQIASPDDPAGIKECTRNIIKRFASGKPDHSKNLSALQPLHKRELTKVFARLLDGLAKEK